MRSRGAGDGRADRGAVTAELALGLVMLMSITLGLVWMLAVGAAQVQVIDASREAARALARGEDEAIAIGIAERIAPPSASISISSSGSNSVSGPQVEVLTTALVKGPGGLWSHLPGLRVRSTAVAVVEQ